MNVRVLSQPLAEVEADALVVGIPADAKALPSRLAALDKRAGGQIKAVLDAERFQAKTAQVTHVHTAGHLGAARVVMVGLGNGRDGTPESARRAAASGLRRARDLGARNVAIELLGDHLPARARAHAVVEGGILGTYAFDRYKKEKSEKTIEQLSVIAPDARAARQAEEGARRGEVFARATWLARDLINSPANDVHPTALARAAQDVAKAARLT